MRWLVCLLTLCARTQATVTQYEILAYQSQANAAAMVTVDKARFTVLTTRLVRMEYAASGVFENRPTLAVVNRDLPVPKFSNSSSGGTLTITTDHLVLTYKGGQFSADSLQVKPANTSSAFQGWSYGMTPASDPQNLRGTFRTLDGTANVTLDCTVNKKDHCEYGLVSRSGWSLIDDTGVPCLDEDDWWTDNNGVMLKNTDDLDLYLLAYGHDYHAALSEYTMIGGKIPIFPRRNSGIWFTRWFDWNNADIKKTVDDYEQRGLPLDVMILDMNWHKKNDWSGYSWDRNLFPFPKDSMEFLHEKGLSVGANLHDATGIGKWEDTYFQVCDRLGLDPEHPGGPKGVPFTLTNKSYVYALEDLVLQPIEQDGMDFWWIDWQQGETGGGTGQDGPRHKMNPTIWTDKMRNTDSIRRCKQGQACTNKRGVVNARWGGLGNHRYQHGFSGDVSALNWGNLAYQAYFSATASNVGWGFWSHDIEGPGNDHEMFARWLQLGSFSGVMRSHDRGMSAGDCMGWPTDPTSCPTLEPYNVPRVYMEANRNALLRRAQLIPYIYTQTKRAFDSGTGLTMPMYYFWPEEAASYPTDMEHSLGSIPSTRQYMFGDQLLVAPVTGPSGCKGAEPCALTMMDVWIPPGDWIEMDSSIVRSGPTTISKGFSLEEVPVYVRAGAIIPSLSLPIGQTIGSAGRQYSDLVFTVYPGAQKGAYSVYEDDGETYDYLENKFGWVNVDYVRAPGQLTFTAHTTGGYPTRPDMRSVTVKLVSSYPPSKVTCGGVSLPFERWSTQRGTWGYDGHALTTTVRCPSAPSSANVTVVVLADDAEAEVFSGIKGGMHRSLLAKRNLDQTRSAPGSHAPDPNGAPLSKAASAGEALSYLAGHDVLQFKSLLLAFPTLYQSALDELSSMESKQANSKLLPNKCADVNVHEDDIDQRYVCALVSGDTDVDVPVRTEKYTNGLNDVSQSTCCAACALDDQCTAWVYDPRARTCWPLKGHAGTHQADDRIFGMKKDAPAMADLLTAFGQGMITEGTCSGGGGDGRLAYSVDLLVHGMK